MTALEEFLARRGLGSGYLQDIDTYFRPLAAWIVEQIGAGARVFGINGAQGTGKSTLVELLHLLLEQDHGLRVVGWSLDDSYLTHAERAQLALDVHPLLATRGVPGTHDVGLAMMVIARCLGLAPGAELALPAFDKASDDRRLAVDWPRITGPVDALLFEGWCVGVPAQCPEDLLAPVNPLEIGADSDGRWRGYVNAQLAGEYQELFGMLDRLILLRAPDFASIARWRAQQENDTARAAPGGGAGLMDATGLARFLQHYERLTRHGLDCMPALADVVLELNADHRPGAARYR